jgi:hypothetical protein
MQSTPAATAVFSSMVKISFGQTGTHSPQPVQTLLSTRGFADVNCALPASPGLFAPVFIFLLACMAQPQCFLGFNTLGQERSKGARSAEAFRIFFVAPTFKRDDRQFDGERT